MGGGLSGRCTVHVLRAKLFSPLSASLAPRSSVDDSIVASGSTWWSACDRSVDVGPAQTSARTRSPGSGGVARVPARMVAVAQLVRAPVCGTGGRGFETPRSPHASAEPGGPSLAALRVRLLFHLAAPLAQRQSNGLLIRRFWVRIPGGAPRSRRSVAVNTSTFVDRRT